MRLPLLVIVLGFLNSTALADERPSPSIVYEDRFIWTLSRDLTEKLLHFHKIMGVELSEGEAGEMAMQYEIVYHNYLTRCDGPLPELAKIVGDHAEPVPKNSSENADYYPDLLNYRAWALIERWRAETLLSVVRTYTSREYRVLPDCVTPGVLLQNDIPSINSKNP